MHVLDETLNLDIGGVRVRALRNHHPPIKDSFALRFDLGGRAVVMSGDTAPIPDMVDFAKGADLLIHEAMLSEGVQAICDRVGATDGRLYDHITRSHTDARDAARIAAQAGVGALALNHLIPTQVQGFTETTWRVATSAHFIGPTHIGQDGKVIDLPAPRT